MRYRRLGDSDLVVSEIALGSWLTYGDKLDADRTAACLRAALDAGITLFDTANVYGRGAAETALGEVLRGVDRSSYVIATKLYFPMSRSDIGLSAEQVRKQCDASLSRLGTDYIDLYQCHRFDTRTPLSETMGALTELVDAGKVRYIGFSEWTPEQIEAAAGLPGVARFTSSQPQYSMLWRRPEQEVFPFCRKLGIGQIVYSPLAQGVLSGKYRPGEPPAPQTRAGVRSTGRAMASYARDEVLAAVHRLRPVAREAGLTMSQLALAWVLRHDVVASAITGATSPGQVRENATGPGGPLGDDILRAVDDAVRDVAAW